MSFKVVFVYGATDGCKSKTSLTVWGPKSHLGGFAQVLSQHDEVDQRLRVATVLWGGGGKLNYG